MSVTHYMKDTIGFVQRLEVFGSDLTVVNAARVSFHKESHALTEGDKKLLNYLAKHDHVSPFFHPQVVFSTSFQCVHLYFFFAFSKKKIGNFFSLLFFLPQCGKKNE